MTPQAIQPLAASIKTPTIEQHEAPTSMKRWSSREVPGGSAA